MLIQFNENTRGNGVVGVHPTGLIVFADFTQAGTFDVMFTGVSKTGNALFATRIPEQGVRKVDISGFSIRGSMCSTSTGAKDEDGEFVFVYPGKMDRCLFVADHINTSIQPVVGGWMYVNMFKGNWRGCGVEDIHLLRQFTLEHAPGYKEKLKALSPRVGQTYMMVAYCGDKQYCTITEEGESWSKAKARHHTLDSEILIDLRATKWVRV